MLSLLNNHRSQAPVAYVEREAWILNRIRGRRVLHLGVVGETDADESDRVSLFRKSFHARLSEQAGQIVGVDNAADVVAALTEEGETGLYVGNVESIQDSDVTAEPLFDVIVVGDLIEHLSNPGLMLDGLPSLLSTGGEIVISTPNAFGLPAYLRFVLSRFREGKQHSLSFNVFTLENLLNRHGWKIDERLTCYQSVAAASRVSVPFRMARFFFRHFPRFGGTLLVTATRE